METRPTEPRVQEDPKQIPDAGLRVLGLTHEVDDIALVVRQPSVRVGMFLRTELHEGDVRQGVDHLLPFFQRIHFEGPP